MAFTFVATPCRDLVVHFEYTEGLGEQSVHSVVIYLNLVNDKLTVEAQETIGTVEIYNLLGATVYSQKSCGNKVEINTADLQSGIYILRQLFSDGVAIRRMMKI